jgi:hypothetical protein
MSLCLCIPPYRLLNGWTGHYETWYVYHGTWADPIGLLKNYLPLSVCVRARNPFGDLHTFIFLHVCVNIFHECHPLQAGLESWEYGRRDSSRRPRDTLYPQKLTLTSPIGGGCPVSIVHSLTQATGFFLVTLYRFLSCTVHLLPFWINKHFAISVPHTNLFLVYFPYFEKN